MKTLVALFIFLLSLFFIGCGQVEGVVNTPKSEFDAPFPKKSNRDLTRVFGNSLMLKTHYGDTLEFFFKFENNTNTISTLMKTTYYLDATGDSLGKDSIVTEEVVLFSGTVSKYKGNYILNQQLNDSSYIIYMLKLRNNIVYGLNDIELQHIYYDDFVNDSSYNVYKMLVRKDEKAYRMHPNKKILANYFKGLLKDGFLMGDTILTTINFKNTLLDDQFDAEANETELKSGTNSFTYKFYPNPMSNVLNVEMSNVSKLDYRILNVQGNLVQKGVINSSQTQLQVGGFVPGNYLFTFINPETKKTEKVVLIKK